MSIETKKMFEIIHENQKKARAFNIKRAKKQRRQEIKDNAIIFLASAIFMIALLTFISMIEMLKF